MKAFALFLVAGFALLGCGQGSGPADSGTVNCQNSPISPGATTDVTPYASNLTASSSDGTVKVMLLESNPAPPPVEVTSTWSIQVNDGSGSPLSNASVAVPLPYMPFHGHHTDQAPSVQAGSGAGQFTVNNLYFFMPGVWQIEVDVTKSGDTTPEATDFYFCIE
jgi:hypothetical protein